MILNLYKNVRIWLAQLMSLFCYPASYLKSQQALQWWQRRQSMQLGAEAEKIRDCLLQQSFTIRRSLELSLLNEDATLTKLNQDLLKEMDKFYHYLKQLSDRLSPAYIEDNLPLAISCLIESWKTHNSNLKIKIERSAVWHQEALDRNFLILRILDELLRITVSELLTEVSIFISLKQQENICALTVSICYPDVATLVYYCGRKDLEYLSQTFEFLMAGQCCSLRENLTVTWYFRWVMKSD